MLSYIEYSLLLREQADTDGLADEEELTILGQLPQLIADYEFQLVDVVADDVHLWCHSVVVGNGLLACVLDLVGHLTGVDEFLNVEKIPLETAVEMVMSNEIKDGKSQAAVLKVKQLRDKGLW